LATAAPDTVPIRLARRGAALLGNVLTADLTREEVQKLVLDGFVPEVSWQAPARPVASGLLAFGLPYERDAAITRHIADFLRKHRQPEGNDARQGEDVLPVVDAVLFNGGLFKSELLVQRVTALLERWAQAPVRVLSGAEPEYAVARGAVWYGLSLRGQGVRISGGSPHGYYVGVHTASG